MGEGWTLRRVLAVLATVLAVVAVCLAAGPFGPPEAAAAETQWAVTDRGDYDIVYEVNNFAYDAAGSVCVDAKAGPPAGNDCTLRQALIQTNALPASSPARVLVTADGAAADAWRAGRPRPTIDISVRSNGLMCASGCAGWAGDSGRAAYIITRDGATVDLLGKIGLYGDVLTASTNSTYALFHVNANGVTIRNIDNLYVKG
ncbi:MAG: hypothetical protein LBH76_06650, partial [Propionibacteriaceae bacterium]|nr:hypothetical protein [Propionibacteriaceae bacterium]